jgi:putative acetyltransferase
MGPDVIAVRKAARNLVRELGFLQAKDAASSLSHSHCHALIEIESRGSLPQSELSGLLRLDKSTTSRIVTDLEARGWVRARVSPADGRVRLLKVTPKGLTRLRVVHLSANARVHDALALLGAEDRRVVVRGMELYAQALERARRRAGFTLRRARPTDRAAIARLIREVMPEFGAVGPGFAILDPEVDDMPAAYARPRSEYHVLTHEDHGRKRASVVGGGGFAPLAGGPEATCELRKMYFRPEARGLGLGQALLERCVQGAREAGFRTIYLETLTSMTSARALYEKNGFRRIEAPLGQTGHYGCNAFYAKDLTATHA